jgi:recombination protein RecA
MTNLMDSINKKYGKRLIFTITEVLKTAVYPTQSYTVNWASGIGGLAKGGFLHEIYGHTGSGKTTLVHGIVANAQKNGEKCFYVDAENRFDYTRAQQIGVNCQDLLVSQANNLEVVFDMASDVLMSGEIPLIIIDSLNTLISDSEYEKEMGSSDMGKKAQMIGKGIKKILHCFDELKSSGLKDIPTVIFTNQIRYSTSGMGNPEFVPGGEAPKYFCSQRIRLQPKGLIDANMELISMNTTKEMKEDLIGSRIHHKHIKNSFGPPHKSASFNIFWDDRVMDHIDEVFTLGLMENIIEMPSSKSYSYKDTKIVGKDNFIAEMRNNTTMVNGIITDLGLQIVK